MGTPNREPQEYSRNILEDEDPGRYIPTVFLLYFWGSLYWVPRKVSLYGIGVVEHEASDFNLMDHCPWDCRVQSGHNLCWFLPILYSTQGIIQGSLIGIFKGY